MRPEHTIGRAIFTSALIQTVKVQRRPLVALTGTVEECIW